MGGLAVPRGRVRRTETWTDVLIVGAGPAGGSAARWLAEEGLRVHVVEMRREVGRPVQCGEAISDVALRHHGLAPDEWVRSRVRGIQVLPPRGPPADVESPGYCVDRAAFDASLLERAVSAGASLWTGCMAKRVAREDGEFVVSTSRGPVRAGFVVAADGPRSSLAEAAGVPASTPCNVGMQFKFPAAALDAPPEWLRMYLAMAYRGGYAWVFPRGPEVSVGVDVEGDPRPRLEAFCRSLGLDPRRRLDVAGGLIPSFRRLRRLGRENLLVVGDAAGATNPIFGGGIHAALATGRMAAEAILGTWKRGDGTAAPRYEREARRSPFFAPVLPRIAQRLGTASDEELDLVVAAFRRRRDPVGLLRLLASRGIRPGFLPQLLELPRLRKALQLTITYGW